MKILSTLGALLISVATYPFGMMETSSKGIPSDTECVTVLVHGFIHNESAWYYLKQRFKAYPQLGAIIPLNLGHPFQSIDTYAKKLQKKIIDIKKRLGKDTLKVYLVGHSMGGLVCIHYAINYALQDHVIIPKIATLASPLQGTSKAKLASSLSVCAKEMLPGSPFLLDMYQGIGSLKDTEFYHVGGGADYIVASENTYLPESRNDYLAPHLAHFSMLYSPSVANHLIQFLVLESMTCSKAR